MRISYSQYATYRRCPQLYRLQYVDKVFVPAGPEMHFGAAIHDALNRMYDPGLLGRPPIEEVVAAFLRSWKGREGQISEEKREAYFEQGVRLLQQHYEHHAEGEEGRRTAACELRFSLDLPGEHRLHGRIDRIDVLPEQQMEVIDYKTSRRMPPQERVEKDPQLAIYRLAADELYPGFEVTTTLFYLLHDHRMQTMQSEEFLAETRADLLDAVTSIELEEFEPQPGTHCEWCAYQHQCRLYRAPQEPEDLDIDVEAALREYAEAGAAEKQARAQKAQAQEQIHAYLDQCETERVERGGYVAERRSYERVTDWDEDRVREVLEPLDRWEELQQVNSLALRALLKGRELTKEQKRALDEAATYAQTKTLRVKPLLDEDDIEETEE
jgi:putative RecB family exonuclease